METLSNQSMNDSSSFMEDRESSGVLSSAAEITAPTSTTASTTTLTSTVAATLDETNSAKRQKTMQSKIASDEGKNISIKIVSASYRPCERRHGGAADGEAQQQQASSSDNNNETIAYTRDVTPFVRALLMAQKQRQAEESVLSTTAEVETRRRTIDDDDVVVSINAMTLDGMKRSQICILDGTMQQSMNSVFGDPCPGTSKRLYISYSILEGEENGDDSLAEQHHDDKKLARRRRVASTAIRHVSFAEHERVILDLRATRFEVDEEAEEEQDVGDIDERDRIKNNNRKPSPEAMVLEETTKHPMDMDACPPSNTTTAPLSPNSLEDHQIGVQGIAANSDSSIASPSRCAGSRSQQWKWRLRATSSEIILPLVMPYLQIKERVACRLVCRVWKNVIRDWGVATTIDNQDPAIYSHISRPFVRGVLRHSYSALHTLFLSGLQDLDGPLDLHPSIPHLRKLACLDISHCIQLGDDTLTLLSQHCSASLRVLYVKGLPLVTDMGMLAICQTCLQLQVLDISKLHALTDQTGTAIGTNLHKLRALYMRDTYRITNSSIDLITTRCGPVLETLTLWGCMRLNHLNFATDLATTSMVMNSTADSSSGVSSGAKLVTLNLWGCHGLGDDWASALTGMHSLKSLVVSECHRLTDAFVVSLTQIVPQLHHLYLRYCKRLTDRAVDAIAENMPNLYSLDLSFCSRVSAGAIVRLLDMRWETLAELRLLSCNLQIAMAHQDNTGRLNNNSNAGRQILHSLRRRRDGCCLSVLDVRPSGASGHHQTALRRGTLTDDDPFVLGMKSLSFEQTVPGIFVRPARWNPQVKRRLVEQILLAQSFHE